MKKTLLLILIFHAHLALAQHIPTLEVGELTLPDESASTVPYLNASKVLKSSSVTKTELDALLGIGSNIQAQINAKLTAATLSDNRLIRGDGTTSIQASGITVSDANAISGVASCS
ncbi:MAG: hypothetical protein HC883_00145 [Bdellovibrionaceae bacterium]|nr:hypothetical protein [Pseudobdellovibrionaceae bacterium]